MDQRDRKESPEINPYTFPCSSDGKESAYNAEELDLMIGSGKSSTEGNGSLLQYSSLEKSHGQRSVVGYSPWGHKESDRLSDFTFTFTFLWSINLRQRRQEDIMKKRQASSVSGAEKTGQPYVKE